MSLSLGLCDGMSRPRRSHPPLRLSPVLAILVLGSWYFFFGSLGAGAVCTGRSHGAAVELGASAGV